MPVDGRPPLARLAEREQRLPPLLRVQRAQPLLIDTILGVEPLPPVAVQKVRDDADDARRVEDVHRRLPVLGRDPHARCAASRSSRLR